MATSLEPTGASPSAIEVICVGLGRTGTLSLKEALKDLGYRPYHYIDFSHHPQWAEVVDGKRSLNSVLDLIVQNGYNVTLENPTCDVYQDILKRYPNAKVILTVRDNPQAFVKSWKLLFDTMVITETKFSWNFPSFLGYIPLFSNLRKIRQFMGTTHLCLPLGALTHTWRNMSDTNSDVWLAKQYERHNAHVIENVPKDQLLVFNVKQGWEPLCKFLDKPVPENDKQFPHSTINNAAALKSLKRKFLIVVYAWIPIFIAGTASCWYLAKNKKVLRISRSSATC